MPTPISYEERLAAVLEGMQKHGISKADAARIHYGRDRLTESETNYVRQVLIDAPRATSNPVLASIEAELAAREAALAAETEEVRG